MPRIVKKLTSLRLKTKFIAIFLVISVFPIAIIGSLSLGSLNYSHDTALTESTDALFNMTIRDLLSLTETYASGVNSKFLYYENQLTNLSRLVTDYYRSDYKITQVEKTNTSINNRYFYGVVNGTVNGSVSYFNYTDPLENHYNDFGASLLGAATNLTIHGKVNLAVYERYSGVLLSSDSYIKLELTLKNGSSILYPINSYYQLNNNSFSPELIDQWNQTNPDGLIGNLSGLNTALLKINTTKINRFFFVYDSSANHLGYLGIATSFVPEENNQPIANRIEGIVDGSINGHYTGIIRGLLNISIIGTSDERLEYFQPLFSYIWNQNQPTFSWIYLATREVPGDLFLYPWNPNYYENSTIYSGVSYDARTRNWYNESYEFEHNATLSGYKPGSQTFWSSLIVDANYGKIGINLLQMIYDKNGTVVGPMVFGMLIGEIVQQIKNISLGKSGFAFVLDQNGNVIISPQIGTINRNSTSHDISLISRGIFNASTLTKLQSNFTPLVANMTSQKDGFSLETIMINGTNQPENVYVAYAPIPSTKWSLAIIVSQSEILNPAIQTGKRIADSIFLTEILASLAVVIGIIISIVFSVLLVNSITKPIEEMTDAAEKISKGDFDITISNLDKENELGQLARSFNRMSKSLQYLMKKSGKEKD